MRCQVCATSLDEDGERRERRGRPPRYCSEACRARAYRARRGGRRTALPPSGQAVALVADARALPLADDSVDVVVTSPPYFALRDYAGRDRQIGTETDPHEYLRALWAATAEMVRVLKPAGSLWVNLGDKYAGAAAGGEHGGALGRTSEHQRRRGALRLAPKRRPRTHVPSKSLMGLPWRYALGCIDELGLRLRAELVWDKPNAVPESVGDRVGRGHEQWFHFTTSETYYARPQRRRRSVWRVATTPLRLPAHLGHHDGCFPEAFPRRFIDDYCPPEGVVLDPFGGTGTTAAAAAALGRTGLSVDLAPDYAAVVEHRTAELGATIRRRATHPDQH